MTEFFIKCKCGKIIHEKDCKWGNIKIKPTQLGLTLNGIIVQSIDIPDISTGILQCKYAILNSMGLKTGIHIIGYLNPDNSYNVKCFNYNNGVIINFPFETLDLTAHTIKF